MKTALVKSKTDWKKLKSGFGDVKLTPEHPEADIWHITRGMVRQGLKPEYDQIKETKVELDQGNIMKVNQEIKDRYHFAKLALFNCRLLHALETEPHKSAVKDLIEGMAQLNGMDETPSLLHQATFLQFGYVCLVWLWEAAKHSKLDDALLSEFEKVAPQFELNFPEKTQISGKRHIKNWRAVIRLIRNAISHGRVIATEKTFEFSDHDEKTESQPTTLTISWEDLGKISETVMHSLNRVIYPTQ